MSTMPAAAIPPARAAGAVRRLPRALRHSAVLAQRNLIHTLRTPEALIDVTLQPVIFLVLFTYVFGGAIANGSQHDYLQYLLPGILGQTIAFAGVAIGVGLNEDVGKGVFDRFRALPIARSVPLVGAVLADVVRYVIVFVVTLAFGYALGFRATTGAPEVLAAGVLAVSFALCLSWASVFVGMKARTPGAVQGIMTLVILPLSFGSSTFVPADTLPGWLRTISDNNPMTHLVGAERALLLGQPMGSHLWAAFAWMAALLLIFVPLALRAYRGRV